MREKLWIELVTTTTTTAATITLGTQHARAFLHGVSATNLTADAIGEARA